MNRTAFELLILGSSAASPTSERNPSAQLLNICERYLLIDCGEGTQIQLRRFKAKFQSIDHIFISHLHGDHFFGLPGLLSSMHLLGRKQDLSIYGPSDLKPLIEMINKTSETVLNYNIIWHETDPKQKKLLFEDDKITIHSFPLTHRIACTGFLFAEKPLPRKINKTKLNYYKVSVADIHQLRNGMDVVNEEGTVIKNKDLTFDPPKERSYAYCSDTIYNEKLSEVISGVDVIYHESTFLESHADRAKKTFHSTASQAARIAEKAKAGKLLLGHYSARYGNLEEFLNEAKPIFENVELCHDGKLFKF